MTTESRRRWHVFVAAAALSGWVGTAQAEPQFEAVDDYVVMEAESVDAPMGWTTETPADAEAERARLDVRYFDDQDVSICQSSVDDARSYPSMDFRFRVHTAGRYWVRMNMRKQVHCVRKGSDGNKCHNGAGCTSFGIQADGDACTGNDRCWRKDISNDAFVQMETEAGVGVPFGNTSNTSIMKMYGGQADRYGWSGDDALDHNAPVYDLEPGDYVFRVRGRSRGLKIDRIIIFHEDADEDAARGAMETGFVSTSTPGDDDDPRDDGDPGGEAPGPGPDDPVTSSPGASPVEPSPGSESGSTGEMAGSCALRGPGSPGMGWWCALGLAGALSRRRRYRARR